MQKNSLKKKTDTNKVKRKKMALGKGLEALIPGIEKEEDAKQDFFYCDIDLIRPNRFQPRAGFPKKICRSWPTPSIPRVSCSPCWCAKMIPAMN